MDEILKALELNRQLNALRPLDKEQEAKIMQKFRLDWNYHSNNIEGNTLTYGETKALIMFGLTAQGKPLKDHTEIKGHNDAIHWIEEVVKGDRPLTENFIRELHMMLLVEPYEVDAITPDGQPTKKRISVGSYKTMPNHVQTRTGEIFYFATPEETPSKMADLMQWYNEKITEENFNPILLAAEFHYRFIRIHPFDDGNGRTARLLMNFILMRSGYPPVVIKTEDKSNYYAVLQLADAGNLEPFVNYIAANLNRSLEIMIAGANGEDIEEPDDIDKEIALLERKLAGYGNDIKNRRSKELVHEIVVHTISSLVSQLQDKLKRFEQYYTYHGIYLYLNEIEQSFFDLDHILAMNDIHSIRVVLNYNTIKKYGLENFRYYTEIKFDFKEFVYEVTLYNFQNKKIFQKNYENLTEKELSSLVNIVIKQHNDYLMQALT